MDTVPVRYLVELKKEARPYGTLVTVAETDSIEVALQKMAGAKIQSLPVSFQRSGRTLWLIVDLLQITRGMISNVANMENYLKQPISSIADPKYHENAGVDLDNDPTLLDLVVRFSKGHIHRLLVTQDEKVVGILTLMDVLHFFFKNLHLLSESLRRTPINQLVNKAVVSVKQSDTVLDSFKIICEQGFYGVAVTDENNKIVNNLSLSDLRGYFPEELKKMLKMSVVNFLTNTPSWVGKDPISLPEKATFDQVMHEMVRNHIHRIYLVDNSQRPIGVVSASDLATIIDASLSPRPK